LPLLRRSLPQAALWSLPDLVGFLQELGAMPALRNTDGRPLVFTGAAIAVGDPGELERCFQGHPDFRVYEHEIVWMRRPMTAAVAATSLAEIEARAGAEGIDPSEPAGGIAPTREYPRRPSTPGPARGG